MGPHPVSVVIPLAWVVIGYPIAQAQLVGRIPGPRTFFRTGSRQGWKHFWLVTMVMQASGAVLCLEAWRHNGVSFNEAGLALGPALVLIPMSIVMVGFFFARGCLRDRQLTATAASAASGSERSLFVLTSIAERGVWIVVSVVVGSAEEVMFRGFGVQYLSLLVGSHAVGITLCAAVFAYSHGGRRQGVRRFIYRFLVFGIGMTAICEMTRSLWAAIAVHIVLDASLVQVPIARPPRVGVDLRRRPELEEPGAGPPLPAAVKSM